MNHDTQERRSEAKSPRWARDYLYDHVTSKVLGEDLDFEAMRRAQAIACRTSICRRRPASGSDRPTSSGTSRSWSSSAPSHAR